jgi:sensor histidine kinase YesM
VRDNGVGLPMGWTLREGVGIGLRNSAERLQELYPDAHGLHIGEAPGGGTLVEVVVPYHLAGTELPRMRSSEAGVA